MAAEGQGELQNYPEALNWYRIAASQGDTSAQYSIGVLYANGLGVARNDIKGYAWYSISAANGNEQGRVYRDALLGRMTREEIAAGQVLAAKCEKSNYRECQ